MLAAIATPLSVRVPELFLGRDGTDILPARARHREPLNRKSLADQGIRQIGIGKWKVTLRSQHFHRQALKGQALILNIDIDCVAFAVVTPENALGN